MTKFPDKRDFGALSRRDFLTGTLSLMVAPVPDLFNNKLMDDETAGEYKNADPSSITIIDTHTHFFDPARPIPAGRDRSIPWPSPDSPLYKPTLPSEWERLARPLGIRGTVVVEAGTNWLEDNDWILSLARSNRSIAGLIGNLSGSAIEGGSPVSVWNDISRFRSEIKRLAKNPLFRGIRVGGNSISGDLKDGHYPHFELLAEADLVIDILGVPAADVVSLAKAVPSLTIVVDHMFNIRGTEAPSQQWRSDIVTLASAKNIAMKVSGLVEGFDQTQTDADIALVLSKGALDHVYQSFGYERLVFGTNWPVCQSKGEMSVVTNIVRKYFEPKGQNVLAGVFASNAKKIYKYVDR